MLGMPDRYVDIGNGLWFGIPIPVFILAFMAIVTSLVLNRTATGARMVLIGANDRAARFSGLPSSQVLIITYVMAAVLAAIAGIVITARNSAASPDFGETYLLLSVVIAVFAGVNPNGGFGTVLGVLLATFILVIIKSGFDLLGVNQFLYQVAQGLIVIGVLALNVAFARFNSSARALAFMKRKARADSKRIRNRTTRTIVD